MPAGHAASPEPQATQGRPVEGVKQTDWDNSAYAGYDARAARQWRKETRLSGGPHTREGTRSAPPGPASWAQEPERRPTREQRPHSAQGRT